jgi:hypothetical protein
VSYKPVVVALLREEGLRLEHQLDRVISPFMYGTGDANGADHECDGWTIGGRWAGRFLSARSASPDLVNPLRFPIDSPLAEYVSCDGGPKGQLDLERMRGAAEERIWRRWPVRAAAWLGTHGFPRGSVAESAREFRVSFDEEVSRARGQALIGTALITLEGEWLEGAGGWPEGEAYFSQADQYIEALDGDVWLVCLMVHF